MTKDLNNITYPILEDVEPGEVHYEPHDSSIKTNVEDYEHPYFTSNGAIYAINWAREFANSKEEPLEGEIPYKVFQDIALAAMKTKVPYDFLLFVMDWEKDLTSRSDGGDAEGLAQKLVSEIPSLRSSLGRDPLNAEVFMAHVLGSASKVKELLDKSINQPEEEAKASGKKKDILEKKKRGKKEQQRTWRELYDFFRHRTLVGSAFFMKDLGKDIK